MDNFDKKCRVLFEQLGEGRKMVLSTALHDHVTSRMMSIIVYNGRFYFQTDRTFRKYEQLQKNPRAALCADNFQIEGICKEIGSPAENPFFCRLYEKNFPASYKMYSLLPNERLFELEPQFAKKWIYEDGRPYEETFDFKGKTYGKKRSAHKHE